MNFLDGQIYRTSIRERIVQDPQNNFSRIFAITNSFDHNEVFENEYDLWFIFPEKQVSTIIYSGFDEDVYDYLENLLIGNNSFVILENLKKKGYI